MKIRCVIGYGCQENDKIDKKNAFWKYLDEEVHIADISDSGFLLHFDGNLCSVPSGLLGLTPLLWKTKNTPLIWPLKVNYPPIFSPFLTIF